MACAPEGTDEVAVYPMALLLYQSRVSRLSGFAQTHLLSHQWCSGLETVIQPRQDTVSLCQLEAGGHSKDAV